MASTIELVADQNNGKPAAQSAIRVAWFIVFSVVLNTLVATFSGLKISFLYKDVLHLSAGAFATVGIITGIPSYVRPFLGAGSDLFPLFGFHRRSYYALSWLVTAAAYLALALLHSYHYATVILLVIMIGLGGNLLLVIVDAVMVFIGNQTGTVGRLQSVQQGAPLLMGLAFTGVLAGYVTQHWSYLACFGTAAAVALLGVPLALLIHEPRVIAARQAHESEEDHRIRAEAKKAERVHVAATLAQAAKSPGLWAVVGFVFYLIITPGTGTAQFFYMVNALHFSKQFLGNLTIPGSAGAIVGLLLFAAISKRLPVRAMVWGAFLMDCSLYLASMGLVNHPTAIAVAFLTAALGMVYNLCLLTIAARACPPGIEGTVYGLVMSAIYFAGTLGDKLGATIYDALGPASHHGVAHGWFGLLWYGFAFTVIAVVFIPFLPAWAKSSEPLHPRAV